MPVSKIKFTKYDNTGAMQYPKYFNSAVLNPSKPDDVLLFKLLIIFKISCWVVDW